jgi:hypothetical protein
VTTVLGPRESSLRPAQLIKRLAINLIFAGREITGDDGAVVFSCPYCFIEAGPSFRLTIPILSFSRNNAGADTGWRHSWGRR